MTRKSLVSLIDKDLIQTKRKNPIEKCKKDMKPLTKEKIQITKHLGKDVVSLEIRDIHTDFYLLIFEV